MSTTTNTQATDLTSVKGKILLKQGHLSFLFHGRKLEEVPVQPKDKLTVFDKDGNVISEGTLEAFSKNSSMYIPETDDSVKTQEELFHQFGHYSMKLTIAAEHQAVAQYVQQHQPFKKVLAATN